MNKLLNKKALKIKLDHRSKYLRQIIVQSLIGGGRGHMGSAMSLVEILRVLYDDFIKINPKKPKNENRDRLILSKGHGCLALYSILADKGFFPKKLLDRTSKIGSILGGHPEQKVPGIEVSTGALGHGLPIAVGMALDRKNTLDTSEAPELRKALESNSTSFPPKCPSQVDQADVCN